MADTSQMEVPPQTNGLSDGLDDDERLKMRPADIDADVKEMERRKRVDMIMSSKLFREELERIIETQMKDGTGTSGLMQQISDMMGVSKNAGHVFKNSNCVVPINDIRGIEAMGYAKGEKILRCKLAAVYRLIDLYGWSQGCSTLITARLNQDAEHFLVNPYGMLFHEITASSLIKVDMQGNVVEQGTTNFSVNITAYSLHAAIHSSRPDIKCIIHVHTPSVVAISALKCGLLPLSEESVVIGDVSTHSHMGGVLNTEEIEKIARNLGPNNKVLLLTNQGAVCCGQTIEEAFFNARNTVLACESQLKLMPMGVDNLVLITDEQRKKLYEAAHKAPESTPRPDQPSILEGKVERKWRVGGIDFEALMRMLDNAGFRTGYIYRHPLVKGEPPKPKNDVEVPPAVSSLGYLLEEEELYRQGLWKKLEGGRKGSDRTRWLNSPNVYQKVEILETGTPDPKKITKWVTDGSPTHSSTPVKIENALQFVPKNTNPKEFKQLQQQIKDYRRADKISAGPQSHILEGVTWEEAKKMQDATVTQTGDQVVLMGAASKGIIQRGFQHNATMYKSPYAKNPFDCVTDEELDEYKRVVERKAKGDFDDTTDYSESEGLSSAQINKRISDIRSPTSVTSETEEESRDEPQVLRIETTQAPKPSQPEVVMSDGMKVVRAYRKLTTVRNYYRTSSYAGLPKGSYLVPNPRHFHLAHYTNINKPMKPHIINLVSGGKYSDFNPHLPSHISYNWQNNIRPTVTINIANSRTITLNISMQTLREFIYPFAAALNLHNLPESKPASCQTSYNTNMSNISRINITEIKNGSSSSDSSTDSCITSDGISEFESRILKSMHDGMISEINSRHTPTDFDSEHTIIASTIVEETDKDRADSIEIPVSAENNETFNETDTNLAGGDILHVLNEAEKDSFDEQGITRDFDFEESGYDASNELTINTSEYDNSLLVISDNAHTETKAQEIISTSPNNEDLAANKANVISSENIQIDNEVKTGNTNLVNVEAEMLNMANIVTDRALELVQDYSLFKEVINETMSLFKDGDREREDIEAGEQNDQCENDNIESINNCENIMTEKNISDNEPKILGANNELPKQILYPKSSDAPILQENNIDVEYDFQSTNTIVNDAPDQRELLNIPEDPAEELEIIDNKNAPKFDVIDTSQNEYPNNIQNEAKQDSEQTKNISNQSCQNNQHENLHEQSMIDNAISSNDRSLHFEQDLQNIESREEIEDTILTFFQMTEQNMDNINVKPETVINEDYPENDDSKPDIFTMHSNCDSASDNIDEIIILQDTIASDESEYHSINASDNTDDCNESDTQITKVYENREVGEAIMESTTTSIPEIINNKQYDRGFDGFSSNDLAGDNKNINETEKEESITSNDIISVETTNNKEYDQTDDFAENNENISETESENSINNNDISVNNREYDQNANDLANDDFFLADDNKNINEAEDQGSINNDDIISVETPDNKEYDQNLAEHKNNISQTGGEKSVNNNEIISVEAVNNREYDQNANHFVNDDFFLEDLTEFDVVDEIIEVNSNDSDSQFNDNIQDSLANLYEKHVDIQPIDSDSDCNDENTTDDENFDIEAIEEDIEQVNFLEEDSQEILIKRQIKEDEFLASATTTNQNTLSTKDVQEENVSVAHKLASQDDINEINVNVSQESCDEGISVSKCSFTDTDSFNINANFDAKIIELGDVIYKYIIKQCYEVKDLVLFPEVLYDENVIKMFSKLKELYLKYYSAISDEGKNELRINLASYILKKIETSADVQQDDSGSSDNVSDKLFTISEFISDILDKFFDQYVSPIDPSDSWNRFSDLLAEKEMCQSTPEDKVLPKSENITEIQPKDEDITKIQPKDEDITKIQPRSENAPKFGAIKKETKRTASNINDNLTPPLVEETLTFQSRKSQSGSELYWISINKSPKNEEEVSSRKREIIDVDNIPLKPPDDLQTSPRCKPKKKLLTTKLAKLNRSLSPIYEEARCNLYDKFEEEKYSRSPSPVLSAHVQNFEYRDDTDFLAGGDYVEFEKPEANVLVLNEAKFFRGPTSDYAYYIQSSGVVFRKDVVQPKHNDTKFTIQSSYLSLETNGGDNDDGNWMGYERAKF